LKLSVGGSTEKDMGLLFDAGKVTLYASISKKGHIPGIGLYNQLVK